MGGLSGNIGNGGLRDRIAGNVEADHSSSLAETDKKVEYNSCIAVHACSRNSIFLLRTLQISYLDLQLLQITFANSPTRLKPAGIVPLDVCWRRIRK
jgi:hypothetical protein